DNNVFSFHIAKIAETLAERIDTSRKSSWGTPREVSNPRDFRTLLRRNRKTKSQDQSRCSQSCNFSAQWFRLAPHLITRSVRANTLCGIGRPISFAVFKLITSSNFVGLSTGRSPGLAPLRILST